MSRSILAAVLLVAVAAIHPGCGPDEPVAGDGGTGGSGGQAAAGGSGGGGGTGGTAGGGSGGGAGEGSGGASCTPGEPCTPDEPCREGRIVCHNGAPVCEPSRPLPDDTPCGEGSFCSGGSCVACEAGAACVPADPCHVGTRSCDGAAPGCTDTGVAVEDGFPCPGGMCLGGSCLRDLHVVVEQGGAQQGLVNSILEETLVVRALFGDVPAAGLALAFVPPAGGAVRPLAATTDDAGALRAQVRLGRSAGTQIVTVESALLGEPVSIEFEALGPAPGTVYPVANAAAKLGEAATALPAPATEAAIAAPVALAAQGDGTAFVADANCRILRVTPVGVLERIAGTSCGTPAGDGGPALEARMASIGGLAVDDTAGVLYLSDPTAGAIRRVDLHGGGIETVAGGGTTTLGDQWDGAPARSVRLDAPTRLDLDLDGRLHLVAAGSGQVLRCDPEVDLVTLLLPANTPDCAGAERVFAGCARGCDVAAAASGATWVAGEVCGGGSAARTPGVISVHPLTGAHTVVLGNPAGSTADGVAVHEVLLEEVPSIDFQGARFVFTDPGSHRIRWIDAGPGTVHTLLGNGWPGTGGDFGPGAEAQTEGPVDVAAAITGDLYFLEAGSGAVRTLLP